MEKAKLKKSYDSPITKRRIIWDQWGRRYAKRGPNDMRDYQLDGFVPGFPPGTKGRQDELLYDTSNYGSSRRMSPYYQRPSEPYSQELKKSIRAFHEPVTTNASGSRRYQKDSFAKKASKVATEALLDPNARKSVLWSGKQAIKLAHSPSEYLNEITGYGHKKTSDHLQEPQDYGEAIRKRLSSGNMGDEETTYKTTPAVGGKESTRPDYTDRFGKVSFSAGQSNPHFYNRMRKSSSMVDLSKSSRK